MLMSEALAVLDRQVGVPQVGSAIGILRDNGLVVYYEYDRKHQLTKETQRDDEGTDIYAWEWAYDLAGNRTQQVFNGVTTDYTYNSSNELTHEITDGVPTYYQYDGCGNQTAKQDGAGTTYFQYDHENLMTRVDFIYQGPDMLKLLQERDESNDPIAQYTVGLLATATSGPARWASKAGRGVVAHVSSVPKQAGQDLAVVVAGR